MQPEALACGACSEQLAGANGASRLRWGLRNGSLRVLTVTTSAVPGNVIVGLACSPNRQPGRRAVWDEESANVSRRLVAQFGGTLAVEAKETGLEATVTLPSALAAVVLAVEDNPHTVDLWHRYLEGTSLALVALTDPQDALAKAIELHPAALILDVMMPGADGWKLLNQLRHHPQTQHIPIIVCTVLPQRDLALALVAADFVRKPVTRASFRAALERQIAAAKRVGQPGASVSPTAARNPNTS